MSSPFSCTRCSRPQALLSPGGLCPECAATEATAEPTSAAPPARPDSFAATASHRPASHASASPTLTAEPDAGTASAPEEPPLPLPAAPPGYDLIRHLGGGGMGDVYLARELPSERLVAIKFLRHPGHAAGFQRFVTELRTLAKLDHPNIVRVLAADFLRATPYFTMEYMEGGSLSGALGRGAAPVAEAVRVIRVIAAAVGAAHAADVIHRDLKPSNVLLAADGTLKVADFGLAKQLDRADGPTHTGGLLGTPGYMPPEQVSNRSGTVGFWSDVYGLGATLYQLLTGRAPFVGRPEAIVPQVLTDEPPRPRALRPEIPLALEAVVVRCLAKNPKERYPTVAAFLADLDKYEAGRKPAAPQLTPARRARAWARRNRRGLGAAAMAALVVAGAFALGGARPKPVPGPTPDAPEKDPWVAAREELAAKRPVTLVGPAGAPVKHDWRLRACVLGVSPLGDGACYLAAGDDSFLELLDDPGIDSYSLSMDVQYDHTWPKRTVGFAGPFVGYAEGGTADPQRLLRHYAVVMQDVVKGGGVPVMNSQVQVLEADWVRQPTGLPLPNKRAFGGTAIPVLAQRPGPWRTIRVDVSPDRLRFFWREAPGAEEKLLAELVRATPDQFVVTPINNPDGPAPRRAALPGWRPRLPLGIWAESCAISFKNVVITPTP